MELKNTIEINKREECCGCNGCVEVCLKAAISMVKDKYGFYYPHIDKDKCIACGKCLQVCPYHMENEDILDTPVKTFAALNKSEQDVFESSSGGIFAAIAKKMLEDSGIIYGCTMDDDFKVRHIRIDSIIELWKIQRSKYVQSKIDHIFSSVKNDLYNGQKVLFAGTPCQVTGLYRFLGEKHNENLLLIDIVCHGVPSQDFFDDYLKVLQEKHGKICDYTFRAKRKAENGMNWFFSFKVKEKNQFRNWPEDSFNYFYMKCLCYRESCYNCKFAKTKRISDITLCDYWSWEQYHKSDFSANATVSGVVVNTKKGMDAVYKVSNKVELVLTKYENLSRHNKCLVSGSPMEMQRDVILSLWKEKGYRYLDRKFETKMGKNILKYKIMRHMPEDLKRKLWRVKNGH